MTEYWKLRNQVGHMIYQPFILIIHHFYTQVYENIFKIAASDKHVNNIQPNFDSKEFNTFFCKYGYKDIRHI